MAMTIETAIEETKPTAVRAERHWLRPALGLLLPLGLALIWELAVRFGWSNGRLVPPPSKIWQTLTELAASGELGRHVLATLSRVGAGFGLGIVFGTLFGAICGYWTLARRLLDPTVQALRAIPSIAWVPLFILWLGIFETSKVALIAVGVFFPIYLGVMGAIRSVDHDRRSGAAASSCRSRNHRGWQRSRRCARRCGYRARPRCRRRRSCTDRRSRAGS